jgi:hypothetical protein
MIYVDFKDYRTGLTLKVSANRIAALAPYRSPHDDASELYVRGELEPLCVVWGTPKDLADSIDQALRLLAREMAHAAKPTTEPE